MKAEILRSVLKIEKFLDDKFLKDGFKEISGFEWSVKDILRLQESLESWFGQNLVDYNGVGRGFLKKLNNLRGLIELTQRESVPELIKVENWKVAKTILAEISLKVESDKAYIQKVKSKNLTEDLTSGKSKASQAATVDWSKKSSTHYSWNLLLFAGSQEKILSMLRMLKLARSDCFRARFNEKVDPDNNCSALPEYPPPGSSLEFELSRKGESYFVKTMLNGVTYTICGRDKYCSLPEFQKLLNNAVHLNNGIFGECMNERKNMKIVRTQRQVIY